MLLMMLPVGIAMGQANGTTSSNDTQAILPTFQITNNQSIVQRNDLQARLWPQLSVIRTNSASADSTQIVKRALGATRYALTPGDYYLLTMRLMGESTDFTLVLQENYDLECPYIGTLNVKGLYFTDLRKMVYDRLKKLLPRADFISLTLSSPALFDVQIFGETQSPGVITACPLTRVSDVVAMAQGVRIGGSIRNIILLRDGKSRTVDLFRYGHDGDENQNPFTRPGDQIYVPKAPIIVVIGGEVQNPGYYELVAGETLTDLFEFAGGLLSGALTSAVEVRRILHNGAVEDLLLDLGKDFADALSNGDRIRVNIDSAKQD